MSDPEAVISAIQPQTRMVWIESPTNPTLKISDIRAVCDAVRCACNPDNRIWVVVDNTFMSPYLQNPLDLGADIVVHSVTKYIGGHSDVVMGAVVTNSSEANDHLHFVQNATGGVPSPFDCYLALRGLKTLTVRMDAAQRNAMAIARLLESDGRVERVLYPGLESHPNHAVAKKTGPRFRSHAHVFR